MTKRVAQAPVFSVIAATAAFFILWTAFFALTPGINGVDGFLNGMYGSVGRNGLTVGWFISTSYGLWFDGIVIAVIFDVGYLFYSMLTTETTETALF